MSNNEKADFIIKDILHNHLPRISEGLEKGYIDENQILVIYDHAVRARILKEQGDELTLVRKCCDELAKYATHNPNCNFLFGQEKGVELKCTCGLAHVLARKEQKKDVETRPEN